MDMDIDIDKEIFENIDIDKISNRLEFGISNRARVKPVGTKYQEFWKIQAGGSPKKKSK